MNEMMLISALMTAGIFVVLVWFVILFYSDPGSRKPVLVRVRVDEKRRRAAPPPETGQERDGSSEVVLFFWLLAALVALFVFGQQF
jgi:hypothetical protein